MPVSKTSSQVRKATFEDFDNILRMSIAFIESTAYSHLYTEDRMRQQVHNVLTNGVVLLDESGHGMIGALIMPFAFGLGLQAMEVCWWVDLEYRNSNIGRELVEAYENWAKLNECDFITMFALDDQIEKFYMKNGYILRERTYMKELNRCLL